VALNTPNIDKLAAMGVQCTDGYSTSPVCAPSRAGFMAGRYQQTFGFYEFYETLAGIPRNIPTIGEVFKQNGYATAFFGKWHSSDSFETDNPGRRGFDRWYSIIAQHDYYDPRNGQPTLAVPHAYDAYVYDNGVPDKSKSMDYLTDTLTEKAVGFIDEMSKKNNPFFLYLPYNAPHPPLQAEWEKLKKYYPHKGKKGFTSRDLARAMIDSADEGIGKILNELKRDNQLDNTLIFFTGDNGGHDDGREFVVEGKGELVQHNGGLRSRKGFLWEGGIRVPYIVAWPGHLPAGKVYHKPVNHLDIFATAASAAHCTDLPDNLDGVNLIPYFNDTKQGAPHEVLFWGLSESSNRWAVRKGDWKLICERPSSVTVKIDPDARVTGLYNLAKDLDEDENLIEEYPEKARELIELKEQFYNRSKPSIVTPEQDRKWRKDRQQRLENPDGAKRRDGYPGCWR
jgi:arylsulfatase A-like enzyme